MAAISSILAILYNIANVTSFVSTDENSMIIIIIGKIIFKNISENQVIASHYGAPKAFVLK